MYGAIIGDLAGSIYEYEQTKSIRPVSISKLIEDNAFFSDDTILTIAIADAILNGRDYEKYLRYYVKKYQDYHPDFIPYFKTAFSPGLIKWANSTEEGKSIGNGALMRISPVAYMFNDEDTIIREARLATIPSHNSEEALNSSRLIALTIYYLRSGLTKEEVYHKLNIELKEIKFQHFNTTCFETIDNCLYVLYNSNSFEDAIKKIISYGGDTDTNACIVGSMAEAMYGVSEELQTQANEKIPTEFKKVLNKAYRYKEN